MDEIARHHAHMAKLSQMGEHWHQKLWNGSGPWQGDRFLNLYHHPLKDEIEVRYEVPNQTPQLVFQISVADFDIDKLCHALAQADSRQGNTASKRLAEAEAHNAGIMTAQELKAQERKEEMTEKMRWALRKDVGHHIAPMSVPSARVSA